MRIADRSRVRLRRLRVIELPPEWESIMSRRNHSRVALRPVPTPSARHIVSAPPVLVASTNTVDYVCADCGAVLMHAEPGQVHNLVILCRGCGSYNATDQ